MNILNRIRTSTFSNLIRSLLGLSKVYIFPIVPNIKHKNLCNLTSAEQCEMLDKMGLDDLSIAWRKENNNAPCINYCDLTQEQKHKLFLELGLDDETRTKERK